MAKKTKRRKAKVSEYNLERRIDEFGEEVGKIGENFQRHAERKYADTFGIIGPIIRSIAGIIFFSIGLWMLGIVSMYMPSVFVFDLSVFFYDNIGLFFAMSLLFNYADYVKYYRKYHIILPLIGALKLTFVLWVIASVFSLTPLGTMSSFIFRNLAGIFILAALIGYFLKLSCCLTNGKCKGCFK
ncbi:MAG: hypothetical protein V1678_04985 [Candidatus Aenigmatarchaeota archaeon]